MVQEVFGTAGSSSDELGNGEGGGKGDNVGDGQGGDPGGGPDGGQGDLGNALGEAGGSADAPGNASGPVIQVVQGMVKTALTIIQMASRTTGGENRLSPAEIPTGGATRLMEWQMARQLEGVGQVAGPAGARGARWMEMGSRCCRSPTLLRWQTRPNEISGR